MIKRQRMMSRQEMIILSALAAVAPEYLYGLAIISAIEKTSRGKLTMVAGTLYPTLTKLLKKGFLIDRWEDESIAKTERRPARHYFRITVEGTSALDGAIQSQRAYTEFINAGGGESPGDD